MNTRRNFLKKAAALAGGLSLSQAIPPAIARAIAIDPDIGSTYYDAEHVVLLMQENRSFDHAFGSLQGVRGFDDPRAIRQPNGRKVWLQSSESGKTFAPFRLDIKDSKITWMGCLPHNWTDQTDARNQGKMDRWLDVKRSGFKEFSDMPLTLGYYTRQDLPFYYSLADSFTICDQHFCSSLTGTNANRLYFWTGNIRENRTGKALVWNGDSEFSGKATWKTFPERLTELGVNWKVYQNEISSSSAGYAGEANSWLANFGCNPLEYFPQYKVKFSKRYRDLLTQQKFHLEKEMAEREQGELQELRAEYRDILQEQKRFSAEKFEQLDAFTKQIHQRAFVNNSAQSDYMELEIMHYRNGDEQRTLNIPKGDILYQFRKDVQQGQLPTVSWIIPSQLVSDHPDSPWFGAWYVSEIMDILTQNPEVWKKTIFILTYDENDGYFDHIAPFASPNPYRKDTGKVSSNIDARLEFVRREDQYDPEAARVSNIGLGYRVPMIIASPWSRGGIVNSQVYDHTSSLQFLEKFISNKTNKSVCEPNISSWRRAICGDLTSVFQPYRGQPIDKPLVLDKKQFLQEIHQAKFKEAPLGFKALSEVDMAQIEKDPFSSPYFPQQEKGIRSSSILPYELYVHGRSDQEQVILDFNAGNDVFGELAAGSPFTVYNGLPYEKQTGCSWNYAVSPGDKISDEWSIQRFENDCYQLIVHGPNGFYRSFKGSSMDPRTEILCTYEKSRDGQSFTGMLQIQIYNRGVEEHQFLLKDVSYNQPSQTISLSGGQSTILGFDLTNQHFWYDIEISCNAYPLFLQRYAGRVESGQLGKSDPLIGAQRA